MRQLNDVTSCAGTQTQWKSGAMPRSSETEPSAYMTSP